MDAFPLPANLGVRRPSEKWDREAFKSTRECLALAIPAARVSEGLTRLRGWLLAVPRIKAVWPRFGEDTQKLLVFSPTLVDTAQLPARELEWVEATALGKETVSVTVGYDAFGAEQVLKALLPAHLHTEIPASYTQVGHIAHMNLREEYLPYKHLVGAVILDKSSDQIKTVVNKLETIDSTFRNFQMEVIAGNDGPDCYMTTTRENDCAFTMDFSKVYWNSRLHREHERILEMFPAGQIKGKEPCHEAMQGATVICDVMAGIGPFAIPAAKKGCGVFANDLNPASTHWLEHNARQNKVSNRIRISTRDGREFVPFAIEQLAREPFTAEALLEKPSRRAKQVTVDTVTKDISPTRLFSHFIMNLPDSALTFLDAFYGAYRSVSHLFVAGEAGHEIDEARARTAMPMIHVYAFSKAATDQEAREELLVRAQERLASGARERQSFWTDETRVHWVRKVAPNKNMYCLSFRLPVWIAFGQ